MATEKKADEVGLGWKIIGYGTLWGGGGGSSSQKTESLLKEKKTESLLKEDEMLTIRQRITQLEVDGLKLTTENLTASVIAVTKDIDKDRKPEEKLTAAQKRALDFQVEAGFTPQVANNGGKGILAGIWETLGWSAKVDPLAGRKIAIKSIESALLAQQKLHIAEYDKSSAASSSSSVVVNAYPAASSSVPPQKAEGEVVTEVPSFEDRKSAIAHIIGAKATPNAPTSYKEKIESALLAQQKVPIAEYDKSSAASSSVPPQKAEGEVVTEVPSFEDRKSAIAHIIGAKATPNAPTSYKEKIAADKANQAAAIINK